MNDSTTKTYGASYVFAERHRRPSTEPSLQQPGRGVGFLIGFVVVVVVCSWSVACYWAGVNAGIEATLNATTTEAREGR